MPEFVGIDPAKDKVHCIALAIPTFAALAAAQPPPRPTIVDLASFRWCEPADWRAFVDFLKHRTVGVETQWISDNDTAKWSGVYPLSQTLGAVRVAAMLAQAGCPRGPAPTTLRLWSPSEWRAVALSPRPFGDRETARAMEAQCAKLLFPGRAMHADHAAAMGIALATAGVNVHTWIPL